MGFEIDFRHLKVEGGLTGDLVLDSNQAVSLSLVFGAEALPTSGGTFFGIESSVLALIEAELVLHLRSPIA